MARCRTVVIALGIGVLAGWSSWGAATEAQTADLSGLLTRAGTAAKSGNRAAAIEALEQAIEQLRLEAPLTVAPFLLVTQPAKFYGDYTPRADAVFRGGEPQQFYIEPKNLVSARTAAGTYEPAFEVDLEVTDAEGKVVATQARFGSFRLPAKSAVHDIYMNLKVTLSGAPPGEYNVRFVVRDLNSTKTATVVQRVTMK